MPGVKVCVQNDSICFLFLFPQFYKHVVQSVEKFIQKVSDET